MFGLDLEQNWTQCFLPCRKEVMPTRILLYFPKYPHEIDIKITICLEMAPIRDIPPPPALRPKTANASLQLISQSWATLLSCIQAK